MSYEIEADYEQQYIFPPSLEEMLSKDDPARFIREFADILDIESLGMKIRDSEEGRPNYSSRLLLKIWLYGWFDKIKSVRELEKLCKRDVGMMWLAGMNQPDHNTLWRFYKDNKRSLKNIFKQSIKVAVDNNLVGMALHAIDGTKIRADVSEKRILRKDKLERDLKELDDLIEKYFEEVEESGLDKSYHIERMPEELKDKSRLRDKIKQSLDKLEEKDTRYLNMTDEDSRIMKSREGTKFSYNSQAVVDVNKSIIVGAEVLQEENDNHAMNRMLDTASDNLDKSSEETVFDAGYLSGSELSKAESSGYNVLINIPASSGGNTNIDAASLYHQNKFEYNQKDDTYKCPIGGILKFQRNRGKSGKNFKYKIYHCRDYKNCPKRDECSKDKRGRIIEISPYKETIEKYRDKANRSENKILLTKRMSTIEPVFGLVKNVLGFRRYKVRGLYNVKCQWNLICTIVNLRKIYKEWANGAVALSQ